MDDVIIVGTGLIGASMAIAAARLGLRVALIDSTPENQRLSTVYDGRTSAVALGSVRVLEAIGVWPHIPEMEPILDIRVCDEGGRYHVHYDHREAGGEPFGYLVENRMLRAALYGQLEQWKHKITLHCPTTVSAIDRTESIAIVTLASGTVLQAPLVMVADGRYSKTRDLLGIDATTIAYGQTAIVCTIAHTEPHHGLAVEKFMPAGPFALLPMTHHRTNVVWSERDAMAKRMLELDEAEFCRELAWRIGDYLGAFELMGKPHAYPLKLVHASRYVDQRLALIGDAAHGIHPIAGQGANLGFRDVAVMAELLENQATLGLDIGSDELLAHYQRWRQFDSTSMTAVTDGINRLFSNRVVPIRVLRDVGMGAVNEMKPLKRFLMSHAMGLVGDLPKMMRKDAA